MRVQTNPSGELPDWEYCIIKPDLVEKQTEVKGGHTEVVTTGGIIVPQPAVDGKPITDPKTGKVLNTKEEAAHTGTLVALGPMAYCDEDDKPFSWRPKIGERVLFTRYSGTLFEGVDGEDYRMMKDRDIKSHRAVTSKK